MKQHKSDGAKLLLASLFTMGLLVATLLVVDARRMQSRRAAATEFQQLVGGLGLGPGSTWEPCPHDFDSRISAECAYNSGPLPGGAAFCPHRTTSILAPAAGLHSNLTIEPNKHADFP